MSITIFLRIGPTEVPIADGGTEGEPIVLGQSSRAFDNTLRSTERPGTEKSTYSFTTPFLEPDEYRDLMAALPHGSFQWCSGLALGPDGVSPFAPVLFQYKRASAGFGWRDPATGVTHDRTIAFTLTEV